jgi:glutamate N-acetyltransferase / amino-acid N-acetyltransferase
MATMLSAVFTDAKISKDLLNVAVKHAASRSFNAISIDGDTSTNDTFAVLSNGATSMEVIRDVNSKEFKEFQTNLTDFATGLAQLIVRDGEGATKFVQVKVTVKLFLPRVPRLLTTPNKSQTQL